MSSANSSRIVSDQVDNHNSVAAPVAAPGTDSAASVAAAVDDKEDSPEEVEMHEDEDDDSLEEGESQLQEVLGLTRPPPEELLSHVNESAEDTAIVEGPSAVGPSDTSNNPSAGPVVASSVAAFAQAVASRPLPASFTLTLPPSRPLVRRQPFPFFRLPAEIRHLVLGVLLTSEKPVIPHDAQISSMHGYEVPDIIIASGQVQDSFLNLLHVSRQCSREAAMIFYTTNTFLLDLTCHRHWLVRITRRNSFLIRHLKLKCFQKFGGNEQTQTWITKLVNMGNTIMKRCKGLTKLDLQFGHLLIDREEGGGVLLARQCLQLFVENQAIRTAWMTNRLTRLKRVTILIQEEWEHTEYLVGLLRQLAGNVKKGVVVEGKHVATVNRFRLPGAPPNMYPFTYVDQERKFFEGRFDRETRTVVTQVFPWEIPVDWPLIYRRVHE